MRNFDASRIEHFRLSHLRNSFVNPPEEELGPPCPGQQPCILRRKLPAFRVLFKRSWRVKPHHLVVVAEREVAVAAIGRER